MRETSTFQVKNSGTEQGDSRAPPQAKGGDAPRGGKRTNRDGEFFMLMGKGRMVVPYSERRAAGGGEER